MLNIVKLLYLWLTFVRNVYLYYDPISSGYIGILPEGPLIILVEVFDTLKLVWLKVVLPQAVPMFLGFACPLFFLILTWKG